MPLVKRKVTKPRVARTRGGGRYTESMFWAFIRSGLRAKSQRWGPIYDCKNAARRPSQSDNKRLKWEYQCAECEDWFPDKEVEVDHIEPAGSLKKAEDLPGFVTRLFCEIDNLRVVCKECHAKITHKMKGV